jgi:hypothetical protein
MTERRVIHCDRCLREITDLARVGKRCNYPVGVTRHCHGRFQPGPAPGEVEQADAARPLLKSPIDNTTRS